MPAFLTLVCVGGVHADGSDQAASGWAGTYAGLFAGFGKTDNHLDVDGFSIPAIISVFLTDPGHISTVKSEIDWVATARAGIEQAIGSATLFVSGGLALARIDNSVTDIDFGPNRPTQVDPDDSFSDDATELGWVLGVGVEAPLASD